jgi:hypothetical protein
MEERIAASLTHLFAARFAWGSLRSLPPQEHLADSGTARAAPLGGEIAPKSGSAFVCDYPGKWREA